MVYCGKPSRGCQMCRTRRIKCDETKPTCQQCQKSRRQCPGYKDDFDIVFRNETKATERRARRGTSNRKLNSPITQKDGHTVFSSSGSGADDEAAWDGANSLVTPTSDYVPSSSGLPSTALSVPVEDQAPCFFITNFVRTPRGSGSRGSFDFVLPIIKTERPDSHVSIAFGAVALASLANRPNSRSSGLMLQAISQYAKALKAINLALQNPAQQKTDGTLAAIILMGLFESVTSEKTNVMAWGSHIEGAVQLTKLRGKKQLRTKTGYALFMSVRAQMLIHCMSASKAPLISTEWWLADGNATDDPGVFVTRLCLRVAELRAEVNTVLPGSPRNPENFRAVQDLMKRAQAMEQEFKAWEESLPEVWRPKTAAWVDNVPGGDLMKADVFPGRVDIYEDLFISNAWNHLRVSRQFLSGIVVRCAAWICHPVDYRTTPEYASSARLGVDMVTDTIASIPFHLGWRLDEDGTLQRGDLSGFTTGRDDITSPTALGGWLSMWCLFCATSSDFTTDSQRTWIRGRMNLIGEVMGLNQARVIGSFQIRLPSMVIRRDIMGHSPPTTAQYAQWAAMGAKVKDAPSYIPSPTPIALKNSHSPVSKLPPCSLDTFRSPPYALTPLQQRDAMKREAWEKEKKLLLGKASNFGGESAERVISDYLAI